MKREASPWIAIHGFLIEGTTLAKQAKPTQYITSKKQWLAGRIPRTEFNYLRQSLSSLDSA